MASGPNRVVQRTILALGGLVVLVCIFVPYWGRRVYKREVEADRAGSTVQTGIATVVTLVDRGATPMGNPINTQQAMVRFQGKLYGVKQIVSIRDLKINHPAQILFRVGKSGRIYVDRVEPLPPAR
jgi:hypothetical protein